MAIDNNSRFWIMIENLLTQLLFSTLDTFYFTVDNHYYSMR